MKKPIWYRLPAKALEDPTLSRTALVLLAVIIDQADTASAELSQPELAEACGCSARSIRAALRELRDRELVTVERTGRASRYKPAAIIPPKKRGSHPAELTGQQSFTADLAARGESVTVPLRRRAVRSPEQLSRSSFTVDDLREIEAAIEGGCI